MKLHPPIEFATSVEATIYHDDGEREEVLFRGSIPASWSYNPSDPWEIAVTFYHEDSEVVWNIDRGFAVNALTRGQGSGNIFLYPSRTTKDLVMVLRDGSLSTTIRWDMREVKLFLDETYQVVPPGEETYDWDAALAEFFNR